MDMLSGWKKLLLGFNQANKQEPPIGKKSAVNNMFKLETTNLTLTDPEKSLSWLNHCWNGFRRVRLIVGIKQTE